MKSSEEMARSVMYRAKAHKKANGRRVVAVSAVALCLCSVGFAWLMRIGQDGTKKTVMQVTEKQKNAPIVHEQEGVVSSGEESSDVKYSGSVTLLHATANHEPVELKENVRLPFRTLIRIRDITGVSDAEMPEIYAQEQERIAQLSACYSQVSEESWGRYKDENVLITTISVGKFVVRIDDLERLNGLQVSVTDVGYMGLLPRLEDYCSVSFRNLRISLDENGIEQAYSADQGGIVMNWNISPQTAEKIKSDPTIRLSEFHDIVTITLTYEDGTRENHVIDMTFDDSGDVYATYRGMTAAI